MSRYQNRTAVLATMHAKEQAIAPPLRALGLAVVVPPALDTDALGTFSGEVERPGSPFDVVVRKARLGMQLAGLPLGLASEGSFRTSAWIDIGRGGHEIIAFVDAERQIEIVEELRDAPTNFANIEARDVGSLAAFLERIGFPSHALIVSPASVARNFRTRRIRPGEVSKGLRDIDSLRAAIMKAAAQSGDGLAHVETDMRAHLNPTRMRAIAQLAEQLAERLRREG